MYSHEQKFLLQWSLTKNLGSRSFRQFLNASLPFEQASIRSVFDKDSPIAKNWRAAEAKCDKVIDALSTKQMQLIAFCDDSYPALLKEIEDPPPILYLRGNIEALKKQAIAVIGTRKPTPIGQKSTRTLVDDLIQLDFSICSGLALGIDGCAHSAALSNDGITIAVLSTGVDNPYPKRHVKLAEDIVAQGGVLISEMPLGTPPLPTNFPRRNRIISGLCTATIVVEAAMKSGSLVTARQAIEQGREVFAFPGSIYSEVSNGCHWLIQQGAHLFTSVDDIIEQCSGLLAHRKMATVEPTKCNDPLLKHMGFDVWHIDELVESTGMPLYTLQNDLLSHELNGKVKSIYGVKWQRIA